MGRRRWPAAAPRWHSRHTLATPPLSPSALRSSRPRRLRPVRLNLLRAPPWSALCAGAGPGAVACHSAGAGQAGGAVIHGAAWAACAAAAQRLPPAGAPRGGVRAAQRGAGAGGGPGRAGHQCAGGGNGRGAGPADGARLCTGGPGGGAPHAAVLVSADAAGAAGAVGAADGAAAGGRAAHAGSAWRGAGGVRGRQPRPGAGAWPTTSPPGRCPGHVACLLAAAACWGGPGRPRAVLTDLVLLAACTGQRAPSGQRRQQPAAILK